MTTAQRARYLKASTLKTNAQILAEWNLNRQSEGTTVVNHITGSAPEDDYFSISSVADVERPPRGIVKAMTSGAGAAGAGSVSSIAEEVSTRSHAYVTLLSDQYKYYLSPEKSAATSSGTGGYAISNAAVEVTYFNSMPCNKLLIGFETGVSIPKVVKVSYRAGGSWTDINLVNPVIDQDGRLLLWRQANGTFAQTKNISTNALSINGVRVQVTEATTSNSYVGIIEVSPRLVVDVSDYVIDASYTAEMSDSSKVTPLGVASSNVASVSLDNSDRFFSNDNPESPFHSMINKGIDFSMYVNPTEVDESPIDSEKVIVFENMSVTSIDRSEQTVSLELKDPSRVLQERKPPEMLIYPCSITEAVLRICHSVGFNDIRLDDEDIVNDNRYESIPYFWTESDKTAWENIAALAEATQTAVYFDEYGKLQIQTRSDAFNIARPVTWFFDGDDVTSGIAALWPARPSGQEGKLADIVQLTLNDEELANDVEVQYYNTAPGKINRGIPEMVVAWEPDGDVVLRSARVVGDVPLDAATVRFNASDTTTWPHTGMFQVEHEVMAYDAKQYQYYDEGGAVKTDWVTSESDKQGFDSKNPGMAFNNAYTGLIRLSKRGLYDTVKSSHVINKNSWYVHHRTGAGVWDRNAANYFLRSSNNNHATLYAADRDTNSYTLLEHSMPIRSGKGIFGASITYPEIGWRNGFAGLQIGAGPGLQGIYVELALSELVDGSRDVANELTVYWQNEGGGIQRWNSGVAMPVVRGVRYEVDVYYRTLLNEHTVSVFVNGEFKTMQWLNKAGTVPALFPAHGLYYRGAGYAAFDYVYHIGAAPTSVAHSFDTPSLFDTVKGGYRSMNSTYAAAWAPYMSKTSGEWSSPGSLTADSVTHGSYLFLDEFGLIAHEVREFNVTYEEKPMMHSKIYLTNESQVACPSFVSTPFGASFVLVNTARVNAVVNGEDTLTYGEDNSIDQKILVYGRQIKQDEGETVSEFNKLASLRDGRIDLTVDSTLIQTEVHARQLAKWIAHGDGGGEKSVSVEVYANPHHQIGDLVAVYHEREDFTDYVRSMFFIVGKSLSYDGGLKLDLELRSVV